MGGDEQNIDSPRKFKPGQPGSRRSKIHSPFVIIGKGLIALQLSNQIHFATPKFDTQPL